MMEKILVCFFVPHSVFVIAVSLRVLFILLFIDMYIALFVYRPRRTIILRNCYIVLICLFK